jgi:hypothetical protein
MPVNWLRLIDGVLGATDLVRWVRGQSPASSAPSGADLEARLAGVAVAALKEAFERDRQRLDLERQRQDADRERAERLLRLEWLRQAGEREIVRQRVAAGLALAGWLGTLVLAGRLVSGGVFGRTALALAWLGLLAALAAAFAAQSRVADALARMDDRSTPADVTRSAAGWASPWLLVAGLGLAAAGLLFS